MRELYLSVICALIRFWDNRFNPKHCPTCEVLKVQVAELTAQNSSLVDRLVGKTLQPVEPNDDADSKLETIHRAKKSWRQIKQELEASHRKPSRDSNLTTESGNDLASFERAIKELETTNVGN